MKDYPWLSSYQGLDDLGEDWWPKARENVMERINKFIAFLRGRSERKIVVVSHGAFMTYLLGQRLHNIGYCKIGIDNLKPLIVAPSRVGQSLTKGSSCSLCL